MSTDDTIRTLKELKRPCKATIKRTSRAADEAEEASTCEVVHRVHQEGQDDKMAEVERSTRYLWASPPEMAVAAELSSSSSTGTQPKQPTAARRHRYT